MIFKPGAKIRIFMGRPPSGAPDGFVSSPPVTMVKVARGDSEGAPSDEIYEALIDTGSDYIAIDEHVVTRIGAPLKGNGVTGRGVFGMQAGVSYAHIKIFFPSANIIFETPIAAVTDLRSRGSFDVLLGRDFLRRCRLTVDGPNAAYDLEWVDNHQSTGSS